MVNDANCLEDITMHQRSMAGDFTGDTLGVFRLTKFSDQHLTPRRQQYTILSAVPRRYDLQLQ